MRPRQLFKVAKSVPGQPERKPPTSSPAAGSLGSPQAVPRVRRLIKRKHWLAKNTWSDPDVQGSGKLMEQADPTLSLVSWGLQWGLGSEDERPLHRPDQGVGRREKPGFLHTLL